MTEADSARLKRIRMWIAETRDPLFSERALDVSLLALDQMEED
jgi:hypothetical protein